jgi:hypothetical protein
LSDNGKLVLQHGNGLPATFYGIVQGFQFLDDFGSGCLIRQNVPVTLSQDAYSVEAFHAVQNGPQSGFEDAELIRVGTVWRTPWFACVRHISPTWPDRATP